MMSFLTEYRLELGAAMMAFLTVLGLWKSMLPADPVSNRINKINARREDLIADQLSAKRLKAADKFSRDQIGMNTVKRVVEKLKLMGSEHAEGLQMQLAQAGYRGRDAMMVFLFFKAISPLIFGAFGVFVAYSILDGKITGTMQLLVSVVGVTGGYYAPQVFVKNMKQKRGAAIRKAMPDALDLLVICAQSGLSLDASLKRVANEMAEAYPELSEEFTLASVELGFLPNRTDALYNLNKRVDLAQMRSLISTLIQTEKYGTPLSNSLRVLAAEYRDERMMKAEEKAARLPAILTLPMIIFILPPLFIVLLSPGLLSAIDSFRTMN